MNVGNQTHQRSAEEKCRFPLPPRVVLNGCFQHSEIGNLVFAIVIKTNFVQCTKFLKCFYYDFKYLLTNNFSVSLVLPLYSFRMFKLTMHVVLQIKEISLQQKSFRWNNSDIGETTQCLTHLELTILIYIQRAELTCSDGTKGVHEF